MTSTTSPSPDGLVTYTNLSGSKYKLPPHLVELIDNAESLARLGDEDFQTLAEMVMFGKHTQAEVDAQVAKLEHLKSN